MDLGPHAAFIWASYGVVTVVLGVLIAGLWLDGRRHLRELALLEAQGLGRNRHADTSPSGS